MIVHSDNFTVGTDTNFGAYGSWAAALGAAGAMRVEEATDRVETVTLSADHWCRWNGAGAPTGDQQITADVRAEHVDGSNYGACALLVRADGSGNGYNAFWTPNGATIELYRVTGGGSTFTLIDSGGTVSAATTYTNAYLKATGTGGTVTLEGGDDTNGAAVVTFADTDAGRHTSGLCAVQVYATAAAYANGGASPVWVDNVEIDDFIPLDRGGFGGGGFAAWGTTPWGAIEDSETPQILLAASLTGTGTVAAALTTEIHMAAALSGTATVVAPLTTEIRFATALSGTATVAAAITTEITFATSLSGTASVAAALTTEILMAASLLGTGTVAAALTTEIQMATSLSGTATVAADLFVELTTTLTASLTATGTVSAALTTEIHMATVLTGTGVVAAALTTEIHMATSLSGTGSLSASLETVIRFAAALSGTGTVTASLLTEIHLATSRTAAVTVAASLLTQITFAVSLSASASVAADLEVANSNVAVTLTGTAMLTASLTVLVPTRPTLGAQNWWS